MPEKKPPTNKLLNRQKFAIFTSKGGPAIYKMVRGDEEFYFDSTDLPQREPEFDRMGEEGWILVERGEDLPRYLISRLRALEEAGLVPSGWGYKKKSTTELDPDFDPLTWPNSGPEWW